MTHDTPSTPPRAAITAVASYLPEGRLTNEAIEERFGNLDARKIKNLTGIRSRCVADDGQFTSDLVVSAAERLFARRPDARDADLLVLTTVTPDFTAPCTAALVQDALGLPTTTGAFDVSLGCSGYVYGLSIAAAHVESGRAERVLLLTGDRMTLPTRAAPEAVHLLFGDGATASLVERAAPGRAGGVIGRLSTGTDGSGGRDLYLPTSGARGWAGAEPDPHGEPVLSMDGGKVFDFTLRVVAPHIEEFLAAEGLGVDDVDLFVLHQANLFMLQHLRRKLGVDEERFAIRLDDVGNTASSTIPLALEPALADGRIRPGSRVLLCGFGVGLSWGTCLLEYVA